MNKVMSNFLLQTLIQKLPQRILAKLGFDKKTNRKHSAKMSAVNELILSKFEATLLGALIGDCIGKKFEGIWGPNLTEMLDELHSIKEKVEEFESDSEFENVESFFSENMKAYSDDIALTRATCDSLINKEDFDIEDMAYCFQQSYYKEPDRGYSSAAITMFKKLDILKQNNELESKCLIPAMELFNGEGSYGNGGGMRCSPIALFTYSKTVEEMKIICELSTRITHTHIWAVIGALQQCYAIRLALHSNKSQYSFDFDNYFTQILNFVIDLEKNYDLLDESKSENMDAYSKSLQKNVLLYMNQKSQMLKNNKRSQNKFQNNNVNLNNLNGANDSKASNEPRSLTYSNLLRKLNKLIIKCRKGERINLQRLHKHVTSCGVSAIESIPMGLFAFMIASDPKCSSEINYKLNSKDAFKEFSPIERVIFYAISFGGDTHKIASMAGAIAGAFFSRKDMPKYLVEMCESSKDAQNYAQQLFNLCLPCETNLCEEEEDKEISDTKKQQLNLHNTNIVPT